MKKNALCIVAHPDDCIIFARPFIYWFNNFDWAILYLTYNEQDDRAAEVKKFWENRNIKTKFLDHIDNYKDMESKKFSFDSDAAAEQIQNEAAKYDLLLTHNEDGEYGHIHHQYVHACVATVDKPKVYFSSYQKSNYVCKLTEDLNLDEIPLHRDVVSQFPNINTCYYTVTDQAKGLVYGNT